ncbi:NLR family CARD domain-containing protein 3 isoform X2 [Myripristis murdjan]|uniref:NLR family, CARD domain containing 3-like n=1 Tax=Myripristis murdjan TaxID=586833 RepID=A0A667ZR42_9TELE|nr:NLR family CARD domain-containing protein 3-like isoform X2 [Myripristis murdjan]
MDSDTEVERILEPGAEEEEERKKWERPPSSYGSMRSDSEEEEEPAETSSSPVVFALPEVPVAHGDTGLQLIRSESPETLYTATTQQTKPIGACVIDTRSFNELEDLEEVEGEEEDNYLVVDSPEPPSPVEPDDTMETEDEDAQPGRKHSEQELPYIFKNIQSALSVLSADELITFRLWFFHCKKDVTSSHVMEGDILDLVDKMIEVTGADNALWETIGCLQHINKEQEAEELENKCKRAVVRFHLKQHLIRKHDVIYEGIPEPGKQQHLNTIYVEPQISLSGYGGIDPYHEIRPHPPSPPRVPSPDTFVSVDELFRLRKDDGQRVKTVLTTGIPGIGLSVTVGKFSLDWAKEKANKDLQFVIQLSFKSLWSLRTHHLPSSKKMTMMEVIEYHHHECKNTKFLEEPDCRFLFIMDSFDRYQAPLDWENSPVVTNIYEPAHPDVLIVNLIRGNLLPAARIWILGRRAAVSNIPARFIDTVTEIQGFSDEMKDDYLSRRYENAQLAANIVAHYKRTPSLKMLCRQPFVCWMVATVFERGYRYQNYGVNPPKLTPFYLHIMIIQTNRKLQHYYEKQENDLKWSDDDKHVITKMGKMALKMLEKNISVFSEDDLREHGLKLKEVAVFSGLCTELPTAASKDRKFCFIHFSFQEFMAALYVFLMLRIDGKNILGHSSFLHMPKLLVKDQSKAAVSMVHSAIGRTLSSPLGHYDMFLRFLCGMLCQTNHDNLLRGNLLRPRLPPVGGLKEVERLLEKTIDTAPADRVENLKECLRELIQEDD